MNNTNLIPFNKLTQEQHRAIASKGGQSTDPKLKSISQKISWYKRHGREDEALEAMYEAVMSPELGYMQVLDLLQKYEREVKTQQQLEKLITMKMEFLKSLHGSKTHQTIDLTTKSFEFKIDLINATKQQENQDPKTIKTTDISQQPSTPNKDTDNTPPQQQ